MRAVPIRFGACLSAAVALSGLTAIVGAQSPTYTFVLLAGGESALHRDGAGHLARFYSISSVAVDSGGALYVADSQNHDIRKIAVDRTVTTLAGSAGTLGSADGVGTAARFLRPAGIAVDGSGTVFVADTGNYTIRRIATDGTVTTWAGSAGVRGNTDGDRTVARFGEVQGLAFDTAGNLYVTDREVFSGCPCGNTVRKITPAGVVSTLGAVPFPGGIAVRADGTVFVTSLGTIRAITAGGTVSVFAGSPNENATVDGTGTAARFNSPYSLTFDSTGLLYVVESGGFLALRRVTADAVVTTIPTLQDSAGVLTDLAGSIVARADNSLVFAGGTTVRAFVPFGRVSPIAGSRGWGSEDGSRTNAQFFNPFQVSLDARGNLYVADVFNHTIRRVSPAGQVTTVAGLARAPESAVGAASAARLRNPYGVAVTSAGTVVIGDTYNGVVRLLANGQVSNLAGASGQFGTVDGQGEAARFGFTPTGFGQQLAVGATGTIYFVDAAQHTIRRITPDGTVTTIAGTAGEAGLTDGTGAAARFTFPCAVAVDGSGTVYIADQFTVRRMTPAGEVTTIGATRGGTTLAVDGDGSLLVGDGDLYRLTMAGVLTVIGKPDFGRIGGVAVGPGREVYLSMNNFGGGEVNRLWVGLPSAEAAPAVGPIADQVSQAGATVQFSATVTGMPTPGLQWQSSTDAGGTWTDLAEGNGVTGVSSATLTVGPLTSAWHQRRFRLVATNLSGATTSAAAMLSVTAIAPSPSALRYGAVRTTSNAAYSVTSEQTVTVLFTGGVNPAWTATANQSWVRVTGGSGSGPGQFRVSIAEADMRHLTGTQTATITIAAPGAGLTTTVPVTLVINPELGFGAPPFGVVDTPAQDATGLVGAVAMTGWALDDIGVRLVRIYRNCASFEASRGYCVELSGLPHLGPVVELGDATIVPGARPDVEAAYPDAPAAQRAGWGFMILTNMLPNVPASQDHGGVGPITLHALAFTEPFAPVTPIGRAVLDQTPTRVTLANDTIARPFGAIDTPGQGATVSGTINNFGWALTPDPGLGVLIPTDGSTMRVFIDGAAVGTVTYNLCRGSVGTTPPAGTLCDDDVSTIFRGTGTAHRNLDAGRGPIGLYAINTTTLTNGLHTLSWGVTDSANRSEGIGSRYINVVNAAADGAADACSAECGVRGAENPGTPEPQNPGTEEPRNPGTVVYARTGFDLQSAFTPLALNESGVPYVRIPELGRVELRIPGVTDAVQVVNGEVRTAPIGLAVDATTGTVTWTPGIGFLGSYRLSLAVRGAECAVRGAACAVLVDVSVVPASATTGPVRMDLDALRTAHSARRVTVSGWAVDPGAASGAGIGAVHVWGTRSSAECGVRGAECAPVFLGTAEVGMARPDVAAAHGAQFVHSGFVWTGWLPDSGAWEVTTYVWVVRTGRFEDARTIVVR